MVDYLIGTEVAGNIPATSQVYKATHTKNGLYLPYMKRSFISFSFGGKNIEDFNLLASIDGDRMKFNGYSDFEDLTSQYDILDGHFYWGTHYTNHTIDFVLATDGINQMELDEFLRWFAAGERRELILSEHPNRVIIARVQSTPSLNLLPFEQVITKKIAKRDYKTSTTLYKGEINLSMIMEEPFWYSKINIFGYLGEDGVYHDVWTDANGQKQNIFDNPDALKIALEDNIPISSMIEEAMLLGDDKYANTDSTYGARTAPQNIYTEPAGKWEDVEDSDLLPVYCRVAKVSSEGLWIRGARIAGTVISESTGIASFPPNTKQYFYYAGTAPSFPTITFTLTPIINNKGYIESPCNAYASTNDVTYNTITFESIKRKNFEFTTPSIYTAYNQTIKIFEEMAVGEAWVNVKNRIRDEVIHAGVRAWANTIIDNFGEDIIEAMDKENAITSMSYFIKANSSEDILSSTFIINSKTGQARAQVQYRVPVNTSDKITQWATYGLINEFEEDVGDMIRSDYLIIEDRNQPTAEGSIVAWADDSIETRAHSHIITHDVSNGLSNVKVSYQNMYL